VFVVVRSNWADWADDPSWHEEDGEETLSRGYFTSAEVAQAWIREREHARVAREREAWQDSLAGARAAHQASVKTRARAQAEWDAIEAAGLTPRTPRPKDPLPFREWPFNEEKVRREIREVKVHGS
jgi:hypothetical protein